MMMERRKPSRGVRVNRRIRFCVPPWCLAGVCGRRGDSGGGPGVRDGARSAVRLDGGGGHARLRQRELYRRSSALDGAGVNQARRYRRRPHGLDHASNAVVFVRRWRLRGGGPHQARWRVRSVATRSGGAASSAVRETDGRFEIEVPSRDGVPARRTPRQMAAAGEAPAHHGQCTTTARSKLLAAPALAAPSPEGTSAPSGDRPATADRGSRHPRKISASDDVPSHRRRGRRAGAPVQGRTRQPCRRSHPPTRVTSDGPRSFK